MRLTDEQAYYLTILGHDLRPVVDVGAGGVTNHDLRRIERALDEQELVKVRVPFGSRARRAETLEQLAPMADAHLVRRDSNSALLYRPGDAPVIALPGRDDYGDAPQVEPGLTRTARPLTAAG